MSDYNAIAISGGKDSTAMLLLMIERNMPIDAVLYADTGMEFPEMKEHMEKLDELIFRERGLHITTLRHQQGFEWFLYDVPLTRKIAIERRITREQPVTGYGWPGPHVRWCTGHLKTKLVDKFLNQMKGERRAIQFVGIAADESHRCTGNTHKRYPLVEWGITEAQALQLRLKCLQYLRTNCPPNGVKSSAAAAGQRFTGIATVTTMDFPTTA